MPDWSVILGRRGYVLEQSCHGLPPGKHLPIAWVGRRIQRAANLRTDRESDQGVEFPDLPGCFSARSSNRSRSLVEAAEGRLAGYVGDSRSESGDVVGG